MQELCSNLLICHYCGTMISENSINTDCRDNLVTGKVLNPNCKHSNYSVKGYCKVDPEHEYLGNGRHYFGEMVQMKNPRSGEESVLTTYLHCLKLKLKLRLESMEILLKK